MFTVGGICHLRVGDTPSLDGWVIGARGDMLEVVFNQPIGAHIGDVVALHVTAHCTFWSQEARVVHIKPTAAGVVACLQVFGQAAHSQQRTSYRVRVGELMSVTFGSYGTCRLVDISASGVCVEMSVAPRSGEAASLRFDFFEYSLNGMFRVRRISRLPSGCFRIGLSADCTTTGKQLEKLAADMQRRELRQHTARRSGDGPHLA